MNSIDFGRAFKAPFDDPDWIKKTLFGMLWGFLIVTLPIVTGAMLDYIKSVSQGNERLPEWDDLGGKWVRGFMVAVAGFIYFLPVWVITLIMFVPIALAGGSNSDAFAALAGGGACLFGLVAVVYSIAVAIIYYAAVVNYAISGEFASFFRFGEIIARVRAGNGYWAAFGAAIVASFAASAVSGVVGSIPVLGWAVALGAAYLSYMIAGHAFGQWAAIVYNLPGLTAAGASGFQSPATPTPGAYAPPAPPAYQPPAPPAYQPPAPPAAPVYQPPAPQAPAAPAPVAPAAPEMPAPAAPVAPAPPAATPAADAAFQAPAAPAPEPPVAPTPEAPAEEPPAS